MRRPLPLLLLSTVALIAMPAVAQDKTNQQPVRNPKVYNLPKNKLGIQGYDPVAYFKEGGGKPLKGKPQHALTHDGVRYQFATPGNLATFKANPQRYEPAYGGWCAWAVAQGSKADIDPKSFIVKNDRLFLFYKDWINDTRGSWNKGDHTALANKADRVWKQRSGEAPRHAKVKK